MGIKYQYGGGADEHRQFLKYFHNWLRIKCSRSLGVTRKCRWNGRLKCAESITNGAVPLFGDGHRNGIPLRYIPLWQQWSIKHNCTPPPPTYPTTPAGKGGDCVTRGSANWLGVGYVVHHNAARLRHEATMCRIMLLSSPSRLRPGYTDIIDGPYNRPEY